VRCGAVRAVRCFGSRGARGAVFHDAHGPRTVRTAHGARGACGAVFRDTPFFFTSGRGAKYCDEYICLFVHLSACITGKLHGQTSLVFVHIACGPGSVLL